MQIIAQTNNSKIAKVFLGKLNSGVTVEFVESFQPPNPVEKKIIYLISTMCGCPIKCSFCDSGGFYQGKLTKEEMFEQIDYLVRLRFETNDITTKKFKIQFARMGEPALNMAVCDVLEEFNSRYTAPGFLPSVSTVAPKGTDAFFDRIIDIKKRLYDMNFQMQFSIHSTNLEYRDKLIPVKKLSFQEISKLSERFYSSGGKKTSLNFALAGQAELDENILAGFFNPELVILKITPVNPTAAAKRSGTISEKLDSDYFKEKVDKIKDKGFEVIISIGELEENLIGSNCGQYISNYLKSDEELEDAYKYEFE
ncbi:MAG: radical SAM protein [Candidatus Kapabacteria bacterium]|nr:radical SAM protein [Candidatus Kapabacteria bacterium]